MRGGCVKCGLELNGTPAEVVDVLRAHPCRIVFSEQPRPEDVAPSWFNPNYEIEERTDDA